MCLSASPKWPAALACLASSPRRSTSLSWSPLNLFSAVSVFFNELKPTDRRSTWPASCALASAVNVSKNTTKPVNRRMAFRLISITSPLAQPSLFTWIPLQSELPLDREGRMTLMLLLQGDTRQGGKKEGEPNTRPASLGDRQLKSVRRICDCGERRRGGRRP